MSHIKLKTGYYSDVRLVALLKNDVYVEKIYGKKVIISEQTSAVLFKYFQEYQQKARQLEINICETKYNKIIRGSIDTYSYIVEFQTFIEKNFESLLLKEKNASTLKKYIVQYLVFFQKVWSANFPIALDPATRNFGIDEKGVLIFFDFFPPHQKKESSNYFLWPEPPLNDRKYFIQRYFTHQQVMVIYAQLIKCIVKNKYISPSEIRRLIKDVLGDIAYKIIIIPNSLRSKIIMDPLPQHMDTLRSIAGELCYENKISYNQLLSVYKNSHISGQNQLPTQNKLKLISNILRKHLTS
ncbi:MAG: hypothetical protein AAB929_05965 [Patescibacteria group bacterium]